jgi:hypothetical protein
MEKKLMEQLGMNVTITHREGEAGGVVVRYKTFDQLEFLCRSCMANRPIGKRRNARATAMQPVPGVCARY